MKIRRLGFTLFEILIAVALLVVLSVGCLPSSFSSRGLASASSEGSAL